MSPKFSSITRLLTRPSAQAPKLHKWHRSSLNPRATKSRGESLWLHAPPPFTTTKPWPRRNFFQACRVSVTMCRHPGSSVTNHLVNFPNPKTESSNYGNAVNHLQCQNFHPEHPESYAMLLTREILTYGPCDENYSPNPRFSTFFIFAWLTYTSRICIFLQLFCFIAFGPAPSSYQTHVLLLSSSSHFAVETVFNPCTTRLTTANYYNIYIYY